MAFISFLAGTAAAAFIAFMDFIAFIAAFIAFMAKGMVKKGRNPYRQQYRLACRASKSGCPACLLYAELYRHYSLVILVTPTRYCLQ